MYQDLEQLKRRLPLLEYLQRRHWQARRAGASEEFVGLCPLHRETKPSFYVNARKNLFYCHGCGRGGDLIRLVAWWQGLSFRQTVEYLQQQIPAVDHGASRQQAAQFYQSQLPLHPEALHYLAQRGLHDPAILDALGIGYACGGNLRRHLAAQGFPFEEMLASGLIDLQGRDTFCRRVIFPLRQARHVVNLYGRSILPGLPHRLLPSSKGGLFAWESVRSCATVILVEGLFDLAVLWQAGFRNTTSAIGTHPTAAQWEQLSGFPNRVVYIAFDQDENQAGQRAAQQLAQRLENVGVPAPIIRLPHGHDPNSYFVAGASAADFAACLGAAQRL